MAWFITSGWSKLMWLESSPQAGPNLCGLSHHLSLVQTKYLTWVITSIDQAGPNLFDLSHHLRLVQTYVAWVITCCELRVINCCCLLMTSLFVWRHVNTSTNYQTSPQAGPNLRQLSLERTRICMCLNELLRGYLLSVTPHRSISSCVALIYMYI